jgi:hypothetical protein
MVHRGVATLALSLALCFLLLSHFDQQFFLVHFYESIVYLAIVLMLFYFEDRWAYMLGILAPAAWLVLFTAIGGMTDILHQVVLVAQFQRPDFAAHFLAAITLLLALAMILVCGYRWRNEFSGLHKGWSTFLVCLGVVIAYYGAMVIWILKWPRAVA